MAKAVFFNIPAYGHIKPSLPLVKLLVQNGDEVRYYATEQFRQAIEQTGAEFQCYGQMADDEIPIPRNPVNFTDILLTYTDVLLPRLLEDLRQRPADYVLHDSVCLWGKLLADRLGLPAICSTVTFALTPAIIRRMSRARGLPGARILKMMAQEWKSVGRIIRNMYVLHTKYGINIRLTRLPEIFINRSELNIIYTSKEIQPYSDEFDSSYEFIGPTLPDQWNLQKPFIEHDDRRPLIFISLGTVRSNRPDFYRACFDAFRNRDYLVIMDVGRRLNISDLGSIPENFRVYNFVPSQVEAISKASLCIYHGGLGGSYESLLFHVPLLLFPQTMELELYARRLRDLGAALLMTEDDVRGDRIRALSEEILANPTYRQCAVELAGSLVAAGGVARGLQAISAFKSRRHLG